MSTIKGATKRAANRGVDTLEIQPRPLRTKARVRETRATTQVSRAWLTVGNSLTASVHQVIQNH